MVLEVIGPTTESETAGMVGGAYSQLSFGGMEINTYTKDVSNRLLYLSYF